MKGEWGCDFWGWNASRIVPPQTDEITARMASKRDSFSIRWQRILVINWKSTGGQGNDEDGGRDHQAHWGPGDCPGKMWEDEGVLKVRKTGKKKKIGGKKGRTENINIEGALK
jgi:hypothetical protein